MTTKSITFCLNVTEIFPLVQVEDGAEEEDAEEEEDEPAVEDARTFISLT